MKKLFFIASFFMLLGMTACSSKDHDVLAVEQLTHRLIPQYADRFVFEIVPEEDRDYYSLESKDGKIHISGNNANSMAAGLNYYLKYYCLTTVSWYADIPVEMPDVLPMVEKPVVVEAKVDNRFFLYLRVFHAFLEMEGLGAFYRLDGVERSEYAIGYNRPRDGVV